MTTRLGRYQIIRPLASGGMGDIYLAEHTGLSGFAKRVVVKQIRPSLAKEPSYVDLFLNEARVGSFLNHPNIVHIFDVGHEGDNLWLVMEYVDGIDLKRLLRRAFLAGRPLEPTIVAAVVAEVLLALEEAHAGGPLRGEPIIHRDLSPENVLIARSGAVKVLDFGLAKWSPGSSRVPSMEGSQIFGKVRYMPPEQLRGQLIDVRADLFALGAVMYETLTNTLPFGSENANVVLANILAGRPPPPTGGHARRDRAMDALVYKALEPEPARRFQTAHEMRGALVEYLVRAGTQLPLEELRRMLHPTHPLGRTVDEADDDDDVVAASRPGASAGRAAAGEPSLPRAPARGSLIDLGVAKRCGKCGGPFKAVFTEGMILDRCKSCGGVWFDHAEIDRLVGRKASTGPGTVRRIVSVSGAAMPAPLDPLIGSCPSCRVGLRTFSVPEAEASLEVCPRCFGAWFDRGEIELLEREDVVRWFRGVIENLRAQL
jgi:serine/threonine-protein kinase